MSETISELIARSRTMTQEEQEATRCVECGKYYRSHWPDCSLVTVESLRRDLTAAKKLDRQNRQARERQFRRMNEQLTLWQGKFHALRHENNKLRRRLYGPAPVEPALPGSVENWPALDELKEHMKQFGKEGGENNA